MHCCGVSEWDRRMGGAPLICMLPSRYIAAPNVVPLTLLSATLAWSAVGVGGRVSAVPLVIHRSVRGKQRWQAAGNSDQA